LTIALVTLAYNEFEWPKCFNQDPLLEYVGSMILKLFSLHSFFWLKSHGDLQGNRDDKLNCLVSLSKILWSDYLSWLGQSQKSRELW